MAYILSKKAEEDIIAIYREGVLLFGPARAEKYHGQLAQVFDFLAAHPEAARERHEITPPVRVHPHGSHMIVYLVEERDIFILRVRHGREDWIKTPL